MIQIDEVRKALRDRYDFLEECSKNHNMDVLLPGFYTEDAFFGGTGVPLCVGRDAIGKVLGGMMDAMVDFRVEEIETRLGPSGDIAYDLTLVHVKLNDGTELVNRSCCIWRLTDDGWLVDGDWFTS